MYAAISRQNSAGLAKGAKGNLIFMTHCDRPTENIHPVFTVWDEESNGVIAKAIMKWLGEEMFFDIRLHNGTVTALWCTIGRTCHPGGHYWDHFSGYLFLSHVTATHFEMEHTQILSTSARSSNELQRLGYETGYHFYHTHGFPIFKLVAET